MSGKYVTCERCSPPRQIPTKLFAAHLRRHDGTDWFSRRRPVQQPDAAKGSRSRDTTEGRGGPRRRWKDQ